MTKEDFPRRPPPPGGSGPPPPGERSGFDLPEGFESDETAVLVGRAKGGDPDALNALFERYHALMVELARRRIGPKLRLKEEPQDLAQTTFREATRDFPAYVYRGPGSLLKWLIQILQNKIRDKAEFYSAGKRDTSLETSLEPPIDPAQDFVGGAEPQSPDLSVTGLVSRDERFRILREALGQLPAEYRQAITLVFFEGMSLRAAGEILGGRSEDALRMLLRRAEIKLGEALKRSIGKEM